MPDMLVRLDVVPDGRAERETLLAAPPAPDSGG